eukprot:jgi/Chrzof1/9691/Cz04g12100.t1
MGDAVNDKDSIARKIVLRLDDGSLIGDSNSLLGNGASGVVLLDCERACSLGRVSQDDLERLDALVQAYQGKVPDLYSLPRASLKSSNPYAHEGQRALKRLKSLVNGDLNHVASPDSNPAAPPSDWVHKCRDVLSKVYHDFGPKEEYYGVPAKNIFYLAVEQTFPAAADNYYKAIRHPVTLKEIEQRLGSGEYSSPQQFCEDMRLVWANCKQYNPIPTDPIAKLGSRLSNVFEQAWAASGLCQDARSRRVTAGVAAAKFEPQLYEQPAPSHKSKSASKGPKNGKHKADGPVPTRSHPEVSSHPDESPPIDMIHQLAEDIQMLDEDAMEGAIALLNPGVVVVLDDGSSELELEKITMDALLRVDDYIRRTKGLPPRDTTEHQSALPSGIRLDQSDSEEEDDSDSDDD